MNVIALIDPCCPNGYSTSSLDRDALGGTEATVLRVASALSSRFRFNIFQANRDKIEFDEFGQILPLERVETSRLSAHDAVIVINSWKVALGVRKLAPNTPILLWLHVYPGRHNRRMGEALASAGIEIMCVSRTHADRVSEFLDGAGLRVPQIGYIHNPIADDLTPNGSTRDRNRLLYASSPHKGLAEVYRAFDALRRDRSELELEIADPGYLKWPSGQAPDGVRHLGRLSHTDLIARMRTALCLFYPQTEFAETFGLVIAEANAVGLPVLVHRELGANDEIVSSPDQSLDCRDLNAIARRLDDWRDTRPDVRAQEQFRLRAIRQNWHEHLQRLISGGAKERLPNLQSNF